MIEVSRVRIDSDKRVYVLLSILEMEIPVFYFGSKTFLSRNQLLAKFFARAAL